MPISNSGSGCPPPPLPPPPPTSTPSSRKPRGRPLGSKNKLRSICHVPMAEQTEFSVNVFVVKVDPNRDTMEYILHIAHQGHVSLSILSAFGTINSVALRNSSHGAPTLRFHGPLKLLSVTGSYLYSNHYTLHLGATPPGPLSFGINFSTSDGDTFSGVIGGRVVAGEGVSLTVSTYKNPNIVKYIPEREGDDNTNENNDNNPSDCGGVTTS